MAKILIVEARFYNHLNNMLVPGAKAAIKAAGQRAEVITVPGALDAWNRLLHTYPTPLISPFALLIFSQFFGLGGAAHLDIGVLLIRNTWVIAGCIAERQPLLIGCQFVATQQRDEVVTGREQSGVDALLARDFADPR